MDYLTEHTFMWRLWDLQGREPNYRSVNLTWEIEEVDHREPTAAEAKVPAFTVFYCEMQTWGPHRCKSKLFQDNEIASARQRRQFSMVIDNLRMATKYTFHVREKTNEVRGPSPRADFSEENMLDSEAALSEQTVIIPTKGFSAHATKCLPNASEIEVETGPFFGGRIIAEGSNCGIKGDAQDPRATYTMRIDHEACGSHVNQNEYTVKTLITVQENLGIFTHSTRRFVVVCTYQPETLTVRASFAVPGRGGATVMSPEWHQESARSGRERNFKMVHKNELITKENDPDSVGEVEAENLISRTDFFSEAKFSRLIDEQHTSSDHGAEIPSGRGYTGLVIAISLSVITMGSLIYLLKRELKQKQLMKKHLTFTDDRFMP
uniref:Putative conserved plasma membrane protein n=1 Tax=Lutzomyia longipalpis TaxID=7200 RepID=A0A1B0GIW5_LUTLO